MLQDLKAGHILGGTPWRMQIGDIIGVVAAGCVMFGVLVFLNQGDINMGGTGFGGKNLPAPQASLMAMLSQGIVGGQMTWPLILIGMLMGVAFILMQVKSPMLISVGMYLPIETTFAIFVGGLIKGLVEMYNEKKKHNAAQKIRVENTGVLLASGFIAGEALMGLVFAGFAVANIFPVSIEQNFPMIKFLNNYFVIGLIMLLIISYILVKIPLNNAGKEDDPAPPSAMM